MSIISIFYFANFYALFETKLYLFDYDANGIRTTLPNSERQKKFNQIFKK